MLDRFRSLVLTASLLVVMGGLAFWIFSLTEDGQAWMSRTFGSGELPVVEFENLEVSPDDTGILICPESYCLDTRAQVPPVWAVSVGDLMNTVVSHLDQDQFTRTANMNIPGRQFDFFIRTPGKAWPDVLTVRFISLSDNMSTMAIYFRTPVGKADPRDEREKLLNSIISDSTLSLPRAALQQSSE